MVNPGSVIDQVVQTLDIARPYTQRQEIRDAIKENAKEDAPSTFSPSQEELQNSWLKREYRHELQAACRWFDGHKSGCQVITA